jgi:hypothetical protein
MRFIKDHPSALSLVKAAALELVYYIAKLPVLVVERLITLFELSD